MKNHATSKSLIKYELEDTAMFCVGETKSLFKFLTLLLVAYLANLALGTFGSTGYSKTAFQVIEATAFIIGSVEYLGSRAIEAWKSLKSCISQEKD
jgi:hypothetical protein